MHDIVITADPTTAAVPTRRTTRAEIGTQQPSKFADGAP
jgi:hypothetical protein